MADIDPRQQIADAVAQIRAYARAQARAILMARIRENLRALGFTHAEGMTDAEVEQSVLAFQRALHEAGIRAADAARAFEQAFAKLGRHE